MEKAARLTTYAVGLLFVLAAAWVFLTQARLNSTAPGSIALAILLLVVGIGIMASTQAISRRRTRQRSVVHESVGPGGVLHNKGMQSRQARGNHRRRPD